MDKVYFDIRRGKWVKAENRIDGRMYATVPIEPPDNKTLAAQVDALSDTLDFHEECIVEMAGEVYA